MRLTQRIRVNTQRFVRRTARNAFFKLFVGLLFVMVTGGFLVRLYEPNWSWQESIWWALVTSSSVGYGDFFPSTGGGRLVAVFVILSGMGVISTLSGFVSSTLIERHLNRDRGMGSFKFKNHYILCNWNQRADDILKSLRSDPRGALSPVVLIADLENNPSPGDDNLHYVRGHISEDTLRRANLKDAHTVVVLGDEALADFSARDARNVLAALVIERINPDVYTIVELHDSENEVYCKHAHVNEVIVANDFGTRLLSRAMLDHGVSQVVHELLSPSYGHHLSKRALEASMVGRPFIDVFVRLKKEGNCTVLGLQHGVNGQVVSNPAADYVLRSDDFLITVDH